MPLFGYIIVIKRNGTDGISFPLTASSCLFGRKTECDIRIQLPQVSKEHCKIEVNENKEAILTNLSTVNPTQLNGSCFQQPVPLKHGDLLTVIDRSFRFEYPRQATPRKRHSRSLKDETLQVLHVQQVAEVELLRKQTPGPKSLHASDNVECEDKNASQNKQNMEENISKALPTKLQTPKSSHRIRQSHKEENIVSPFSKLYEKLKRDIEEKKPLHKGNASQLAAKEDGKSVLLEPSGEISSSCVYDLGSLTKQKEIGRSEYIDECQMKMKKNVTSSEFNLISLIGSATKKSFTRSPRPAVSKEVSGGIDKRSHLLDHNELSTAGRSKGTEVTTNPSKENDGNAAFSLDPCSIERLDCGVKKKISSSAAALDKVAQTTNVANVTEVDKHVLSTPTPRRKSLQSRFVSLTKETGGMNPVNTPTRRRVSLLCQASSVNFPEVQDLVCRNTSPGQLPLAEDKCLIQRRSGKQQTPGKPVKGEQKEICDQANSAISKQGHSETPASLSKSKGPRRSDRQSKELSNKSVHSEILASEELMSELASPASQKSESGRKKGRARTSGLLTDKALETNAVQEHHDKTTDRQNSGTKELATKGYQQRQALEDAGVKSPRRLSSKRRSSRSAAALQDNEAVSEMAISGLFAVEETGKPKRTSRKRKSDNLLLQPLEKRKRVSFGGHLSPELFDKSLPPNSPLKKGGIPARLSLMYGNSPRAVLKKAQGLKRFGVQELTERLQKDKMSPKTCTSPASEKATRKFTSGSPAPYRKGRFSVSSITTPSPIAEEKDATGEDMNTKEKNGARVQTPKSSHANRVDKTFLMATPDQLTRSVQLAWKATPTNRRSGVVAVINAKRRSGASSANLLVAKSWAEVVKLGVARPQFKAVKKSVRKGRSLKKTTQSAETPERKIKGHFSTGHAASPATIVVGRAYSTTVSTAGQVPKVVKNPTTKLNVNMDESFTGMTEMFQTPENKNGRTTPMDTVQDTDFTPTCTPMEISDLHTPEETGEMVVSPLNSSDASERKQDGPSIYHSLREKTPKKRKSVLEENMNVDSLSRIPEKQASLVKSGSKSRTPKHKLEPAEVSGIKKLLRTPEQSSEPIGALSGIKRLMKSPKKKSEPVEDLSGISQLMKTPKEKLEPVEAVSGIKRLVKTPKQKPEPVEDLSGIRQLMKTPKQKPEPVEDLSGIRQLMKTPKQKPEPVEDLSGIRQLMKTPKQKPEPVEDLSGIRQLMKTPKQKPEPVEDLSGIRQLMKTPKQKPEPVEDLSGIRQLMKTPKQKPEPVEDLSGIRQLMKTPKQKPEPVEDLSGIRQLMKTPKQKPEPVEDLSGIRQLMKTPQQELEPVTDEIAFTRLLKTPVQEREAVKDMAGITSVKKTPKLKYEPVEDMIGVSHPFKTPKEKVKPMEDIFGISRLVKTPREKYQPVDDFVGLQRLMAEPKGKCSDFEVDYVGVKELFDTPEEIKEKSVNNMDSKQEDTAPPCPNSSHKYEDKGNISQGEESQQKESTVEDQSTQRQTRGRARKTAHPASAKQCGKDLNLKELQSLEKKSTQEEMGISVAKNKGRGRRTNRSIQEVVSKHPGQEKVETVSFEESCGATQRTGRGKRKPPGELNHPNGNLESCGKDSSVLRNEPADMKQNLIDDKLETEDVPTTRTVSVSSSIENENCQLPTGLKNPENKSHEGGLEDSAEMLLSPRRRSRGVENVDSTELLIPPKRLRRARDGQVKRAASEHLPGKTRKLRKDPSAELIQREEQTLDKDSKMVTAGESENATTLEIKIAEKRVKSLRSARRLSAEIKADTCPLENTQNVQKTKETLTATDTEAQSHIKNGIEMSQAGEMEHMTEASKRLKSESPSGGPNKIPVTALSWEANGSAIQETHRTRNRRGKKDSLDKKNDEFAKDTPKFKSETEMDEYSLKDSSDSVCVKNTHQVTKDQDNTAATSGPAASTDSLTHSRQTRTRNEQGILKPKQTEILQENQAQKNGATCRRGRSRKVNFEAEEASSKVVGGQRSLPGDDKGLAHKDGQQETSENPSSQLRRSRRKQVDSIPEIACSTFMEKQTLIADHRTDEAFVKEQDSALEATPSSSEDNPWRRRQRQEVAAASKTSQYLSIGKRRGLLEGGDKKMAVREDQNPALGNVTLQAKADASTGNRRKKIDLAAEAKSSSSLQRKCDLSETDAEAKGTNEDQNMPLETESRAKVKPLRKGRRKETALASHTTNYISLRGRHCLSADNGREEALKDGQNIPLQTFDSSTKDQLRKGRRKETASSLGATSSTSFQGKQGLLKESGRKNSPRAAKRLILENSASKEKVDFSKRNLRQTVTSLAVSSTSLQGLPEDGKNEPRDERQVILLEVAPPAKASPSRVGRKRTVSSRSEKPSSAIVREERGLPKGRGQKRILDEVEATSLQNNSPQGKTRELRNKRERVEFKLEATTSTFLRKKSSLTENRKTLKTPNVCLTSPASEKNNQSRKGEGNPVQQATATFRRRKCQLPADESASKKFKSENDENRSLQKGKRNKTKEELGEEDVRATRAAGGMERRTRSSTRTSAGPRPRK